MAWWQFALIAFVLAWGLQALGVWRQTRHFRAVFGDLRTRWSDGALGAGAAPAKLGKGVIAIVVVDPEAVVRAVRIMRGRSVFAEFKSRDEFTGLSMDELKARAASAGFERGIGGAILKAIEQIEKVRGKAANKGSQDDVLQLA